METTGGAVAEVFKRNQVIRGGAPAVTVMRIMARQETLTTAPIASSEPVFTERWFAGTSLYLTSRP